MKSVVLLSGGLDSLTILAIAKSHGFECHTLSFDYGQKHRSEIEASAKIAAHYGASHRVINLKSLGEMGGSALTSAAIDIPDATGGEIPATYVPARNIVFLSVAVSYAEVIGSKDVFIGVSSVDYSGYPDCRPEFIEMFQKMVDLGTKAGVEGKPIKIHTPLMYLSKAETIRMGRQLGVDYSMSVSCYRADDQGQACGRCDSCDFRKKGFAAAGITDPTRYMPSAVR